MNNHENNIASPSESSIFSVPNIYKAKLSDSGNEIDSDSALVNQ